MKCIVMLLSVAACGGRAEEAAPPTAVVVPAEGSAPASVIATFVGVPDGGTPDAPPAPPLATGPIRIAFGSCAALTARFESGAITAMVSPTPKLDAAPVDPGVAGGAGQIGLGDPFGGGSGQLGIGSGFGGRRMPSRDDLPSLKWGEVVTKGGDLDKTIVRRYLRRQSPKLTYCYEKALLADSKIAGVVATVFTIDVEGNVSSATADGGSPTVAACMSTVIKSMQFPKPKDGTAVEVRQSFTLVPGRIASRPIVSAPVIRPAPRDWKNPLPIFEAAIAECLRPHPKSSGVLAIDLAYDKLGAATSVTVNGVDDPIGQCIAKVIKPVKHGANTSERCPIAFGALALADTPLTITVAADTKPQDVLDKVRAHAAEARKAAPPAAMLGPVVVRAGAPTLMGEVNAIVTAITSAGVEPAFATVDGNAILGAALFPRIPRVAGSHTDTADPVVMTLEATTDPATLAKPVKQGSVVELRVAATVTYEAFARAYEALAAAGAGEVRVVDPAK